MKYKLAVILPTYNEAENISILICSIDSVLKDINSAWEAIIVDDSSPDHTYEIALELSAEYTNIRCFKRIGRKGLASAVIDGMMMTNAAYIAVMDTDLQHDASHLVNIFNEITKNDYDIVIGSRFDQDSQLENFDKNRAAISNIGNYLARKLIKYDIKDPLRGFFMIKGTLIHEVANSLTGIGFKILLDILASSKKNLNYKELPFIFKERNSGKSKLNTIILLEFIYFLSYKFIKNKINF